MNREILEDLARKKEAAQAAFDAVCNEKRAALVRKASLTEMVDLDIKQKRLVRASCAADRDYDDALAEYINKHREW